MACYHVGVIGGGISGLSCASRLQELGVAVSLYDTGVRGPGGRASSRLWKGFVVDHAAQFAEARTPEFMQYMESLENEGKVKRLAGMGSLLKPGVVEPMSDAVPRFVGIKGMGSIPDAMPATWMTCGRTCGSLRMVAFARDRMVHGSSRNPATPRRATTPS